MLGSIQEAVCLGLSKRLLGLSKRLLRYIQETAWVYPRDWLLGSTWETDCLGLAERRTAWSIPETDCLGLSERLTAWVYPRDWLLRSIWKTDCSGLSERLTAWVCPRDLTTWVYLRDWLLGSIGATVPPLQMHGAYVCAYKWLYKTRSPHLHNLSELTYFCWKCVVLIRSRLWSSSSTSGI